MIYDDILFYQYKTGSRNALDKLYKRLKLPMLKTAVVLTQNTAAAEDIVQDIFMHLVKNKKSLGHIRKIRSYLFTAVANRARNYYRENAKQPGRLDERTATDSRTPDRWLIKNEQLTRLAELMNQLNYDQREVVLLHIEGGLKFRQIAEIQNISVNTATSRYRYGIEKLRCLFNEDEKS